MVYLILIELSYTIKKYVNKEVRLVISSGRPAEIKDSISKMIGISVDAIGLNGQQIMTEAETLNLASFPVDDYLKITDWLSIHYPETSTGTTDLNGIYYVNDLNRTQPLKRFSDHKAAGIVKDICSLPAAEAFKVKNIHEVGKLLVYLEPSVDAAPVIQGLMNQFKDKYDFIRSNQMFIEGVCRNHSKKTGIETYIKINHLNVEDCFCAGDADNDIEMLEFLKNRSFCMKAGTANAKKAAAHQVSNLAEALEIICKNGRD